MRGKMLPFFVICRSAVIMCDVRNRDGTEALWRILQHFRGGWEGI